MLDGKLEEGSFQLVSVGELGDVVARLRPFDRQGRQLDGAPEGSPDLVSAGVDEEPVQPGVEGAGVAQAPDLPPGLDEGVLDGILRGIPIAQDASRDRVQPVVCGGREGIERLVVASLCAFDESDVNADSSGATRSLAAFTD